MNSLSSVTPTLTLGNCYILVLTVNVGAITTTATQLMLEGSDDGGLTFYNLLASNLTVVASSTVNISAVNIPQMVRAKVAVAGSGVTAGYVLIRGT